MMMPIPISGSTEKMGAPSAPANAANPAAPPKMLVSSQRVLMPSASAISLSSVMARILRPTGVYWMKTKTSPVTSNDSADAKSL